MKITEDNGEVTWRQYGVLHPHGDIDKDNQSGCHQYLFPEHAPPKIKELIHTERLVFLPPTDQVIQLTLASHPGKGLNFKSKSNTDGYQYLGLCSGTSSLFVHISKSKTGAIFKVADGENTYIMPYRSADDSSGLG